MQKRHQDIIGYREEGCIISKPDVVNIPPTTLTPTFSLSNLSHITSLLYVLNNIGDTIHPTLTPRPIETTLLSPRGFPISIGTADKADYMMWELHLRHRLLQLIAV